MRPITVLSCLVVCAAFSAPVAHAAEAPDALPSDLDALSLADAAPSAPVAAATPWRVFVEGNLRRNSIDGPDPRFESSRASIDARFDTSVAPRLRAVFSNRLDLLDSNRRGGEKDVNTLREAYLSWALTDQQIIDVGRVNLRHGAAYGYNPTDWFKEGALRSIVSPDPAVLRENRQGTVVLQGQQLFSAGSLKAAFSPYLAERPNSGTFSLNAGATNPRNRWLLAGSSKFSDKLNAEVLLYGGDDTAKQLGLNLSGLIGDATVVFGEFSTGEGRSLIAQALGQNTSEQNQKRAALGLTYTTSLNLSLTVEAEYNEAGATRRQWNALPGIDPSGRLRLLGTSQTLQDLPARRAGFAHALWKDAFVRHLDVSAFVRRETATDSRIQWLEARYHWERAELIAQWQQFSGARNSIFGSVPQSRTVELALRFYL